MLPAPAEGSPVAACSRQCTRAARHIQQQQPPTEKFASSKMLCPLGRAEGRGSGHKSMPRRACVPRGLECERRVCVSLLMSRHMHICSGTIRLPTGAVRPSAVFGSAERKFETSRSDVRLVAARDTRAASRSSLINLYRTADRIRRRGRVRGRAPPLGGEGAEEPSRGTAPSHVRYGPRRRAAAAVYDKVISSLNVVVAGSRFSLASFILRSLVFRHIAASGPGASAFKI